MSPSKSASKRFKSLLPKTMVHKGVKYYLLDRQYSLKNAQVAVDILGSRGPAGAKYLIRHDTLDGRDHYGIYTTSKVGIARRKKS